MQESDGSIIGWLREHPVWRVLAATAAALGLLISLFFSITWGWGAWTDQKIPDLISKQGWWIFMKTHLVITALIALAIISAYVWFLWILFKPRKSKYEATSDNPEFKIKCDPNIDACLSTNVWAGGRPVRFLHAIVSLNSGSASKCKAYLLSIKGKQEWDTLEQLTFSNHKPGDALERDLVHEVPYCLDVLAITSDGEIHVCNNDRQWTRWSTLKDMFAAPRNYRLALAIGADGVPTKHFTLNFNWTENWQASFLTLEKPVDRTPKEIENKLLAFINERPNPQPLEISQEDCDKIAEWQRRVSDYLEMNVSAVEAYCFKNQPVHYTRLRSALPSAARDKSDREFERKIAAAKAAKQRTYLLELAKYPLRTSPPNASPIDDIGTFITHYEPRDVTPPSSTRDTSGTSQTPT